MAGIYQVVPTFSAAGQIWQNVLHYKLDETGSGSPTDYATALLEQWQSTVAAAWLGVICNAVDMRSIRCKKVSGLGGATVITLFTAGSQSGTFGATLGQTCECAVIEYPVFLNLKNVTGKIFLAGLTDDSIVANTFSDAFIAAVQPFEALIFDTLTLSGGLGSANFTIFNRETGTDTVPTFSNLSPFIGTQRRRLRPQ